MIRYSEHINGNGDEFFKHACEYGIEGIVSKLANHTTNQRAIETG
jgi:ATP-dependent DNA ligase